MFEIVSPLSFAFLVCFLPLRGGGGKGRRNLRQVGGSRPLGSMTIEGLGELTLERGWWEWGRTGAGRLQGGA